mgnify:CR=1 FL=1
MFKNVKKCRFFLATGKDEGEQKILNEILNTELKDQCVALDNYTINETLPLIKNCNIAICNDTGFAHLSSALGIKTITLMADTPLIYGSYSTNMYPIIPDGEQMVSHNTLAKDKINSENIISLSINGSKFDDTNELYIQDKPKLTDAYLKFVPYYLWSNRGENEMLVWINEK